VRLGARAMRLLMVSERRSATFGKLLKSESDEQNTGRVSCRSRRRPVGVRGSCAPCRRPRAAPARRSAASPRDARAGRQGLRAALVLGVSEPPVRAWIDAGVVPSIRKTKPVRVDLLALADLKRAVDLLRANLDDRQLLAHVMRLLRDRPAIEGAAEGIADYRAGRTVALGDDLKAEIAELREQGARRRPAHTDSRRRPTGPSTPQSSARRRIARDRGDRGPHPKMENPALVGPGGLRTASDALRTVSQQGK